MKFESKYLVQRRSDVVCVRILFSSLLFQKGIVCNLNFVDLFAVTNKRLDCHVMNFGITVLGTKVERPVYMSGMCKDFF